MDSVGGFYLEIGARAENHLSGLRSPTDLRPIDLGRVVGGRAHIGSPASDSISMNGVSIGDGDSPSFHSVVKHLQPDEFTNDRNLFSARSAGNAEGGLRKNGGRPVVFRFDGVNEG